jgi:hypothetical protein
MNKMIKISGVIIILVLIHSCYETPTITTIEISEITSSSAKSGGNIRNDHPANDINMCGICWSTSPNPTLDPTKKTIDGVGPMSGIFRSTLRNLSENTTYYVKAYVVYSTGGSMNKKTYTTFGNQITFKTLASGQK